MRFWTLAPLALLLLLVAARPAAAQRSYGCCGFRDWATYGADNLFRYHPTADAMGGTALLLIARGPWFAPAVRDRRWKRLAIVTLGAAAWQYQNLKEIDGYRWDYAGYDLAWTVASAALVDLAIEALR